MEAEKEYLKNAFAGGVKEVHVPTYRQEGYVRGKNDIGGIYIEVDMGNQKHYIQDCTRMFLTMFFQ